MPLYASFYLFHSFRRLKSSLSSLWYTPTLGRDIFTVNWRLRHSKLAKEEEFIA